MKEFKTNAADALAKYKSHQIKAAGIIVNIIKAPGNELFFINADGKAGTVINCQVGENLINSNQPYYAGKKPGQKVTIQGTVLGYDKQTDIIELGNCSLV